jgi:hypothetical protein
MLLDGAHEIVDPDASVIHVDAPPKLLAKV